ncbi:MAG TPA: glycosyltransferase family 4 protein [Solirubrobacteraceae bacterium]|jgi:glycosyltransferase involved in cell wall biosynthesis|nr:glycosyltransferase family 4 protein [Solirubrobacteraceae bacterium]
MSTRCGERCVKPVLFVTNHAPTYRVGAFARLHELEDVEFALFGGRLKHGGGTSQAELPFPHRHVSEHQLYALAASGRYRAVVCPTNGRLAVLATWAGARRARVPLILWASLWAHPRSLPHAFSYPALRRLYRSADAVVTYGPHVSAYVRARGAQRVYVAPQSVDNAFWSSPDVSPPTDPDWPNDVTVKFLFAGRPLREKGLGVLVEAWSVSGLKAPAAALVLVGAGSTPPWVPAGGAVVGLKLVAQTELRNFYAAADVLVLPSIPTRTFREPWGLVVNEAMNRGLPVITSDAVGAAAGGLVREGRNGLIVAAGDPIELAAALTRLARDPALRARMGEAGREDVAAYTHDAWAQGFARALGDLELSRGR